MRYRNKYVDTLKFLAVFIVFVTHYTNRFGEQYQYVFYELPSSILLYGVSGKMGVAILGVIMGWLAYESKRDISEAIVHRYCFFFVSVLLINVFYNIWNCFQGTDFSVGSFVQSCLLLDNTFFPALWFIKEFFLAYIISILNKCGKIEWGG